MKKILIIFSLFASNAALAADPLDNDPYEVRLNISVNQPTENQQAWFRRQSGWSEWNSTTDGWMAIMSDRTGLPHRAWGGGLDFSGENVAEKHEDFVQTVFLGRC